VRRYARQLRRACRADRSRPPSQASSVVERRQRWRDLVTFDFRI